MTNQQRKIKLNYKYLINFLLVFTLIVIVYNHFIYNKTASPTPGNSELSNMSINALQILSKINELLITLSTAIFGLIGYLAVDKNYSVVNLPPKVKFYMIASLCFAVTSIDFGLLNMENWADLLSNDIFEPDEDILSRPRKFQYLSFIISLFFLGKYFINLNSLNETSK